MGRSAILVCICIHKLATYKRQFPAVARYVAFLFAREHADAPRLGPALKQQFGGVFIANERFTPQQSQEALDRGEADAIAFGVRFLANPDLPERLRKSIAESPLNEKPGYVYSDLSFYLYPQLVQQQTGKSFEQFLSEELYRPLGATTLGLHPQWRFPQGRIVPTEYDSLFRKQLLHGTVHDEGAALQGGLMLARLHRDPHLLRAALAPALGPGGPAG